MKSKSVIFAIILFVAINTSFLWERLPSGWDLFLTLSFGFIGLILVFVFLLKLGGLFLHKFKNRNNIVSVVIIGAVLAFCFLFPLGLVRSSYFDPDYYLIASREGSANCQTTIILGIDNTFIERSVCFGVDRNSGTYTIKNDTVFLTFDDKSNFGSKETVGVINLTAKETAGYYGYFSYFKNLDDKNALDMAIIKMKK